MCITIQLYIPSGSLHLSFDYIIHLFCWTQGVNEIIQAHLFVYLDMLVWVLDHQFTLKAHRSVKKCSLLVKLHSNAWQNLQFFLWQQNISIPLVLLPENYGIIKSVLFVLMPLLLPSSCHHHPWNCLCMSPCTTWRRISWFCIESE